METKMRRFRQQLDDDAARNILVGGTNGVLSLAGNDGTPYGVPLSYAYDNDRHIYFHSAKNGRKIDYISERKRCSFCVVAQDDIKPEEFTTYFRSVIVAGNISEVKDEAEIMTGLRLLCLKYSPGIDSTEEIRRCISHVTVLRLDIIEITGKEAIELTRQRNE